MNLFSIYATLGLDAKDFEKGVDSASRQGKGLASDLKNNIGGAAGYVGKKTSAMTIAMGHALYDMGKAAVKGAAELGKSVISEYAQTEQLVGGVKKMFGDDFTLVVDNANNAFKTAGLSANEYMETVTSFSATLLKGLGGDTQKAAEYADMAVRDMADNANTFGTDITSIQNAYQGFAKQNYTMLDNLKLGYGGTKSEMKRLLKDAEKIQRENGVRVKYSINSFDDIVEAIHVMQKELGIAGTTENEAFATISGSFNTFKSSWKNWLSGLANDEADVGQLTDDLVETGKTALANIENVIPTVVANVTTALSSLGTTALDAGTNLLASLYTGLTGDTTSPELIKTHIGTVFDDANTKITGLIDAGKTFFTNFLAGLNGDSKAEGNIVQKLGELFKNFNTAKNSFITAGSTILGKFYTGLTRQTATAENIGKTLGDLFGKGITGISDFLAKGATLFTDFLAGLNGDTEANTTIGTTLGAICADGIANVTALIEAGKGLFSGFLSGLNEDPTSEKSIVDKLGGLFSSFNSAKDSLIALGGTILGSFYEKLTGQEATAENIGKTLGGIFDAYVEGADKSFEIAKTFFTEVDKHLSTDYKGEDAAKKRISGVFQAAADAMTASIQNSKNFLANIYEAITGDTETADKIRQFFTFSAWEPSEDSINETSHVGTSYQAIVTDLMNAGLLGETGADKILGIIANEPIFSTKYKNVATLLYPLWEQLQSGKLGDADTERIAKERLEKGLTLLANSDMESILAQYVAQRMLYHQNAGKQTALDTLFDVEDNFPLGAGYQLLSGTGRTPYNRGLATAWDYNQLDKGFQENGIQLQQAAQALMDAAAVLSAALTGAHVELDGEKVGELVTAKVEEDVVRKMRTQFPTLAWGR